MPPTCAIIAALLVASCIPCIGCGSPANSASAPKSSSESRPAPANPITSPAAGSANVWPLFRGDPACQGVSESELPKKPEVLWRFKPGDTFFDATAVIVDDTVYVGDGAAFHALRLADGKPRWSVAVDQGFMAAAAVKDGKLFVGDAAGVFHCYDAKDGREIWKASTAGKINSSPNLYAGSVLFGSQDGSLYRLNCADGKEIWKYSIKADGGIQSSPTLADGHVLFAGCDGSLHVVDAESGRHVGSLDLRDPTLSTAAVVKDQAYFGTEGGNLLAVDWRQPKLLWTYRNPRSDLAYRSSAAATAERVIIGGRNKTIECLSPADGKRLWTYMTGGGIDGSPVIAGDRVYVGSADGRLYGLSLESGKVLWKFDAGGGFTASPAIANGRLVIGNENGTLYCFGVK